LGCIGVNDALELWKFWREELLIVEDSGDEVGEDKLLNDCDEIEVDGSAMEVVAELST
jgi:hypothetical protein